MRPLVRSALYMGASGMLMSPVIRPPSELSARDAIHLARPPPPPGVRRAPAAIVVPAAVLPASAALVSCTCVPLGRLLMKYCPPPCTNNGEPIVIHVDDPTETVTEAPVAGCTKSAVVRVDEKSLMLLLRQVLLWGALNGAIWRPSVRAWLVGVRESIAVRLAIENPSQHDRRLRAPQRSSCCR